MHDYVQIVASYKMTCLNQGHPILIIENERCKKAIQRKLAEPFDIRECMTEVIDLLGNGIKFTERGSIAVSVSEIAENYQEGYKRLEFRIKDSGIGIPKEYWRKVFQPFYQIERGLKRNVEDMP